MHNQQTMNKSQFPRAPVLRPELRQDPTYQRVQDVLADLWRAGLIQRGSGYCIGMSDLVVTMLRQKGIHARMVECQLTLLGSNPPTFALVGHPRNNVEQMQDADVDTHCVAVVDQGEIPLLIDCSIGHLRPGEVPFICDELNGRKGQESTLLAEYKYGTGTWVYHVKESSRIPHIHQFSMVERIQKDRKIQQDITRMRWLVAFLVLVVSVNFARGLYDTYQTYVVDGNYWGPSVNRKILERLDRLEHVTNEQNEKLGINTSKENKNGQ